MACVYRYTDLKDGIIKYVGIVHGKNRTLRQRVNEHLAYDDWCKNSKFRVDYLNREILSRTEAECYESHFIALYGTGKYYNRNKAEWGLCSFIKDCESEWKEWKGEPVSGFNADDCVYKIGLLKDLSFDITPINATKSVCSEKTDGYDYHCIECGSNNIHFVKNSNNESGQMICKECGGWACQANKGLREIYNPEYCGEYKMYDGEILTYNFYIVHYGGKNEWVRKRENELREVVFDRPMARYGGRYIEHAYTFAISLDEIEHAKQKLIQEILNRKKYNIANTKKEIASRRNEIQDLQKQIELMEEDCELFLSELSIKRRVESATKLSLLA